MRILGGTSFSKIMIQSSLFHTITTMWVRWRPDISHLGNFRMYHSIIKCIGDKVQNGQRTNSYAVQFPCCVPLKKKERRSVHCTRSECRREKVVKNRRLVSSVNRLVNFTGPAANFAEDALCMPALCRVFPLSVHGFNCARHWRAFWKKNDV